MPKVSLLPLVRMSYFEFSHNRHVRGLLTAKLDQKKAEQKMGGTHMRGSSFAT
jgi:hypothetical protein